MRYCEDNPGTCKNDAKCNSIRRDEGSYRCLCREGTSGRNCEFSEIHTVKPFTTKAPAMIPISNVTEISNSTVNDKDEFSSFQTTTDSVTITTDTTKKSEPIVSENET